MTDEDDVSEADSDPIDAQFEPAAPSADHVVTPEKTRRGPGWKSLIATGLLATILGAGVGAGISGSLTSSLGTGQTPADTSQYEAQLAELAAAQQKFGSRLAALGADLEQVEAEIAEDMAHFGEEIDSLTTTTPSTDPSGELSDALAALSARVDLLSALPEGEGGNEETSALSARLLAFEQGLANVQTGQSNRAEAIAALTTRLTAIEAEASEEGIDQAELVSLYEDISALKAGLAEVTSDTVARAELVSRIDQIEAGNAAVRSASDHNRASGQSALAMLALEAASDRGDPFPNALAALGASGADAALLADLATLAPTGAPTLSRLQVMFDASLLAARTAPRGSEGWPDGAPDAEPDDGWGWVRRTFGDSVKITRSGETTSENEALEAFAETAGPLLANGNVSAAMTRLSELGEADRTFFADWQEGADRRIRLDAALIALRASLLEQER